MACDGVWSVHTTLFGGWIFGRSVGTGSASGDSRLVMTCIGSHRAGDHCSRESWQCAMRRVEWPGGVTVVLCDLSLETEFIRLFQN